MIDTVRRRLSLEIVGAVLTAGIFAALTVVVADSVVSVSPLAPRLERAGRAVVAGSCLVASLVHIVRLAALVRCRITGTGMGLAVTAVVLAVANLVGVLLATLTLPPGPADYGLVAASLALTAAVTVASTPSTVRWVQAQQDARNPATGTAGGQDNPQ